MTSQEKELLSAFLEQLVAVRAAQKDPEAEAMIREAVARQPEAAYLLVQRALQLDQALQMTQAQVRELEQALAQSRQGTGGGTSFLSDPAWGSRPGTPQGSAPQAQRSVSGAPLGAAPPMQAAPTAAATRPSPWGGSSMLGTVASTAAGVVAGSFLFQGIQSLMHHNDPAAAHGLADTQSAFANDNYAPPRDELSDLANIGDEDSDTFAAGGDDSDIV